MKGRNAIKDKNPRELNKWPNFENTTKDGKIGGLS
jgi:hypothetical protein